MPLTIAHLSDIHLSPLPRPRIGELAPKRLLALANWKLRRRTDADREALDRLIGDLAGKAPDHIVVTGDLVNLGLPAEFAAAGAWLRTLGSASNVSVVPGNHDAYVGWRRRLEFGALAANMLASPGESDIGDTGGPTGMVFPYVRIVGDVALIGLSSAVPSPPLFANGRLGAEQLRRLERVLPELRRRRLVRVVLIHHPPLPSQVDRRRGLDDAAAFAAVIDRHGAELVLHGHMHRHMLARTAGGTPVIGVTAARSFNRGADPAGYNLVTIDTDGGRCKISARRRVATGAGSFVDAATHEFEPATGYGG